jgi:thiosulfate/3-mercaptopyruvate sulfurtransferase
MPGSTIIETGWQIKIKRSMLQIRNENGPGEEMTLRHIVFDSVGKAMLIYGIVSILFCCLVISSPALADTQTDSLMKAFVSPVDLSPNDTVLDISPDATRFIEGAVNINYEDFMGDGGQLKSAKEIATLLGEAGLSSNDSLVIAGECLPCGGGPSPAFFSYWLLKYLGHERVRILEGHLVDWASAGLNLSNRSATRQKTQYVPHLAPNLLATYEFVVNGGAQIVDARPARDYAIGSIPGAVNIAYENVLINKSIKPVADLEKVFAKLEKDRPVLVYTNLGVEASIIWLALQLTGYDARLYSWRDWLENQPKFNFELTKVEANPNPVSAGQATTITASFRELQLKASDSSSNSPSNSASSSSLNPSTNEEVKLTVKGCATCGFGSPQGFANLDRKDGYVQIGSTGKTAPTTGANVQKADSTLRCSAIINAPDGSEVARTSMLQTSPGKYVGIWSANVAPGIYKVSIVATSSGNAETFVDVLNIEVTG